MYAKDIHEIIKEFYLPALKAEIKQEVEKQVKSKASLNPSCHPIPVNKCLNPMCGHSFVLFGWSPRPGEWLPQCSNQFNDLICPYCGSNNVSKIHAELDWSEA